MGCKHNAFLVADGVKKCLLCGAVIPEGQETPAGKQKQAAQAAADAGTDKTPARKTTRKNGK